MVRQLDAAGAFLGESPVVLRRTGDGWLEENGFTQFVVALPGVAFLQIAKGATVLAQNPRIIRPQPEGTAP